MKSLEKHREESWNSKHLRKLREPEPSKISHRTIRYSYKKNRWLIVDFSQENMLPDKLEGESILENMLMALLEQDSSVVEYLHQAVPRNRDSKFSPFVYQRLDDIEEEWIPDFAIIWQRRRPMVIECKPLVYILINWKKLKNKFEQAENYAHANGWDFYVFTDAFKARSFRVDNIIDLESQLQYSTRECKESILVCFRNNNAWTIKGLQKELESKFSKQEVLASVFYLVYFERLFVDLDKEITLESPITTDSSDYLPLDEWLLQYSWKQFEQPENLSVIDENALTKRQKEKWEHHKAIVKAFSNGLGIDEIQKKLPDPRTGKKVSRAKIYRLWNRSEQGKNLIKLLRRGVIEKTDEAPGSGRPKQYLFETIIDRSNLPSDQDLFLDEHFFEAVQFYETSERPDKSKCWRYYLFKKRMWAYDQGLVDTLNSSFRVLKNLILNLPRKAVFLRELNRYETEFYRRVLTKREGLRKALKDSRNITGATPFTNYIGEMVQIDHTPADILGMVPLSIHYEKLEKDGNIKFKSQFMSKAQITVAIDVHTRAILGYSFRYRNPSRESSFMAIRRTVLGKVSPILRKEDQQLQSTVEKILRGLINIVSEEEYQHILEEIDSPVQPGGLTLRQVADWWDGLCVLPRMIHTDQGRDFQSGAIQDWAHQYKVSYAFRPVGAAQYGGHVERVLRRLNSSAFHSIQGTTWGDIEARGDYPSEDNAILTFEQMEAIFLLAMLYYHVSKHRNLGIPPMEAWERAVTQGCNLSPLKTKEELQHFAYNTLLKIKRKYQENSGIQANTLFYNYEALPGSNDKSWTDLFQNGHEIEVRADLSDIRYVWWWNTRLKQPVRVWARSMRLGDREYNSDQLKRLPPISKLQYDDLRALNKAKTGISKFEMYEQLGYTIDNIQFITEGALPRSSKERQQFYLKQVRALEIQRIGSIETKETAGYLTEETESPLVAPHIEFSGKDEDICESITESKEKKILEGEKKKILAKKKPQRVKTIKIPPRAKSRFAGVTRNKTEQRQN